MPADALVDRTVNNPERTATHGDKIAATVAAGGSLVLFRGSDTVILEGV